MPQRKFTRRIIDYSKKYPHFSLLDEDAFIEQMNSIAHPVLEKYREKGDILVKDGALIHYETYFLPKEQSRATILMFHGYTGFTGKFYEMIYYFLMQNYSVVVFDFRGHGFSTRELEDGFWAKAYVKDFSSYVTDTETLFEKIVLPNKNEKPLLLYGHSMGGGVAVRFMELHPDYFDGAVLNCPMIGIKTAGLPNWLVKIVCYFQIKKNGGTDFVLGMTDFDPGEFKMKPSESASFNRYHYYHNLRKADEHYFSKSSTYKWMSEAIKGAKMISDKNLMQKISVPILMFQSEKETYVKENKEIFFAKNAKNVDTVFMTGTEHEIFSSHNKFLDAYYYEIFSFYDKVVLPKR